ncbi:MAG TPA: hypothetical protein VLR92_09305, partial [Blastocatellia bacterium]|nr:hypothetical protein [Blastocatellia bacterium]
HRRFASAGAEEVLEKNPKLAHYECQAGKHKEPGEVAARDVVILWPVYRKIPPPPRLVGIRSAIGCDCYLFAVRLKHRNLSGQAVLAS